MTTTFLTNSKGQKVEQLKLELLKDPLVLLGLLLFLLLSIVRLYQAHMHQKAQMNGSPAAKLLEELVQLQREDIELQKDHNRQMGKEHEGTREVFRVGISSIREAVTSHNSECDQRVGMLRRKMNEE